jgi:hypothetical protein
VLSKISIFSLISSFVLVLSLKASLEQEVDGDAFLKASAPIKTFSLNRSTSPPSLLGSHGPVSPHFMKSLLSADSFVTHDSSSVAQEGETPRTSLVMPKSAPPRSEARGRPSLGKPKYQIFSHDTPGSEELKKNTQKSEDAKVDQTDQKYRSASPPLFDNPRNSSARSSPRDKSGKSYSPKKSVLNVQSESPDRFDNKIQKQDLFSSSPRTHIDGSQRVRKSSGNRKIKEKETFVIPIEMNFPSNSTLNSSQIVLNMPEISVPTSIVLSFHFPSTETQETLAPQRVLTRKRAMTPSKKSPPPLETQETQFYFESEFDQKSHACNDYALNPMSFSSASPVRAVQASLLSEGLLDQILLHTVKYRSFFLQEGLEKTSLCLSKIDYFVELQVLLRADNQYLSESLKTLYDDYICLAQISDPQKQERKKTDLLLGILNCHNDVCVSANKDGKSRYQDQHDAVDIMLCEFVELYEKTTENFPKIEKLNPKLIRENEQLISSVSDFFKDYVHFLMNIEQERFDFLNVLNTFCGNTKREMKIDEALDGFASLIGKHQEAVLNREKISLSNMVSSVGEIKATFSEKVLTLRKSDTPPSCHESSCEDGKKKRNITPRRFEKDFASQKK